MTIHKNMDNNMIQQLKQAVQTIKTAILQSQSRAVKMVSGAQLSLYFGVGLYVSVNSRQGTWGTGAIDDISLQLRRELPGLRGFSSQNIRNMRQFAEFWQTYLNHSPMASKMEIEDVYREIEYDRFSLAKWSPWRPKLIGMNFLASVFLIIWRFCIKQRISMKYC